MRLFVILYWYFNQLIFETKGMKTNFKKDKIVKQILRLVEVAITFKQKIHSVTRKNQVIHVTRILVKMVDFVQLIKQKMCLYVFAPRYIQGLKFKLV